MTPIQELAESPRVLALGAAILDGLDGVAIVLDPGGRVQLWNAGAALLLGIDAASAIGRRLAECPAPLDHPRVAEAVAASAERRSMRLEPLPFLLPGGAEAALGIGAHPLAWSGTAAYGALLLGRDITEKVLEDRQAAQVARLESLGALAAGIAHEINTPIQFIGDNLRFLRQAELDRKPLCAVLRALADDPGHAASIESLHGLGERLTRADFDYYQDEVLTAIEQSLEGIERVAAIVRAMRDFSHPPSITYSQADVNRIVTQSTVLSRHEWSRVAMLEIDADPSEPIIWALESELGQVVLNLVVNAAQAIAPLAADTGNHGHITVSTRAVGAMVEIRVADTGCGIPEAIRNRVFDPFFTTKPVGMGTGQGLSFAYAAVKRHGGTIAFESQAGQGTTFVVRLPVTPPGAAAPPEVLP